MLLWACASSNPPPQTAEAAPPKPTENATERETPLYVALAKLQSRGEVLGALSQPQRAQLEKYVAAVTPEQRELLLAGEDPAVASRPILYLAVGGQDLRFIDRKSTRLNSSHVKISYAVFILKIKK